MVKEIIDQVVPVVATGVVAVLVAVVKCVGDEVIDYLKSSKEVKALQGEIAKNKNLMDTGKNIWNIVEENYRIKESVEGAIISKAESFDKLLLEKCPYLTQQEIEQIRQAIGGEVNKGKQVLAPVVNTESVISK